jgi:hypothetical protein
MRCLEDKKTIVIHLCKYGLVPGYEVWIFHVEKATQAIEEAIQTEIPKDPPTTEVEEC